MSDLVDKVRWLTVHDEVAQRIGSAGRELAEMATLEKELERSVHTVTAALRSSSHAAGLPMKGPAIGHEAEQSASKD
jgi:hypothetical protein